ncbi:hypothetical protein [Thioalkalivibrio thiocyanodenitrificans]|uniref:hypothetical protein n=1 Tax=Thioalkalivibrio thiocyanodenitrificans TaxID=243063 RepID=UPI0003624BCB|nr:hypothetical protein [Thioalkalivibrio thiocyanodenitrificans]
MPTTQDTYEPRSVTGCFGAQMLSAYRITALTRPEGHSRRVSVSFVVTATSEEQARELARRFDLGVHYHGLEITVVQFLGGVSYYMD